MNLPETTELETFEDFDFAHMHMPLIVIYSSPSDFPDKYVARLFDVNKFTRYAVIMTSLDDLRQTMPKNSARLERHPQDDSKIVETWLVIGGVM